MRSHATTAKNEVSFLDYNDDTKSVTNNIKLAREFSELSQCCPGYTSNAGLISSYLVQPLKFGNG